MMPVPMPFDVKDSVELILHERWENPLISVVVEEASFLVLHGHLSFANTLLSALFHLHKPTWGVMSRYIPLALESIWAETQTRPLNAPALSELQGPSPPSHISIDDLPKLQRQALYRLTYACSTGREPPEVPQRWWNLIQLIDKYSSSPQDLYDNVSPLLDDFFRDFLATSDVAFDEKLYFYYMAAVVLKIDILLRTGELDRARAFFDQRAIPTMTGGPVFWRYLLIIPGIYPFLSAVNILSSSEASQRVETLIAALTTRLTKGVARLYAHLSWNTLLDKFVARSKTEWLEGQYYDEDEWETPICAPATEEDIVSMQKKLALDIPLPEDYTTWLRHSNGLKISEGVFSRAASLCRVEDVRFETWPNKVFAVRGDFYIAFLRHSGGFKGVWPASMSKTTAAQFETWPADDFMGLKVEFRDEDIEKFDNIGDGWPSLERVIAIDGGGGKNGDVWLIEPAVVAKARQFAINVRREKYAKDHGLPLPVPGHAPTRCPMPLYVDSGASGYLFHPATHGNINIPPEIIENIVQCALDDVGGYGDRATALALCSSSRRMHELAAPALWQTGWLIMAWTHWGLNLLAYESFREYMESRSPPSSNQ